MADKFDRLIRVLEKDLKLTGTEIAEILWLAMQLTSSSNQTPNTPSGVETPTVENQPTNIPEGSVSQITASPPKLLDDSQPQDSRPPDSVHAKVLPKPLGLIDKSSLPIKAPDTSSLRNPLNIAKALRPLIQYISYGKAILLDENATVERIAELEGIFIPVLKPLGELKFDVALVVDQSDSMIFWQRTTQELQQILKHYGIFRNLQTWGMITNKQGDICLKKVINKNSHSHDFYSPRKLIDPSGRRLILVASDCVSEIWRNGKAFSVLKSWGKQNIVAIVQMLPERMWLRTALSLGSMVQLKSSSQYVVDTDNILLWNDVDFKNGIKIPVFILEPTDLIKTWSEMVVGQGTIGSGGFVFSTPSKQEQKKYSVKENPKLSNSDINQTIQSDLNDKVAKLSQEEIEKRVYNFQMSSSEIAQNLAKLLSAVPVINLPIVRLIQKTLLPQSQQCHVAEVFLGGILKPQTLITPDINCDEVQYDFIDIRIRDIFLKDSPRTDSREIITIISQDFANRLGKTLKEFYALLKKPDELEKLKTEQNVENFDIKHFATITTKVLRRLGGAYALFAEEIEQSITPINELNNNIIALVALKIRHGDIIDAITPIFAEITPDLNIKNKLIRDRIGGEGGGEMLLENEGYIITGIDIERGNYFGRDEVIHLQVIWHKLTLQGIDSSAEIISDKLGSDNFGQVSHPMQRFRADPEHYISEVIASKSERTSGETFVHDIDFTQKKLPDIFVNAHPSLQQCKFKVKTIILIDDSINPQTFDFEVAVIQVNQSSQSSQSNSNNILEQINEAVFNKTEKYLTDIEKQVLNGALENLTYKQIHHQIRESANYPESEQQFSNSIAKPLWKVLTEIIGEKVTKSNVKSLINKWSASSHLTIDRYSQQATGFIQELNNNTQLEMMLIPGGTFIMGSPSKELKRMDRESPQHSVTVQPFFMGKYQITQAQWRFVAQLPQVNRELEQDPSNFKGDNRPVENVSWYDAVEFCDRLSKHTKRQYRLPSEAEWEYACRAGTTTQFHFGETITTDLANYDGNSTYGNGVKGVYREETTEVGSFGVANNSRFAHFLGS